MHLYLRAVGFSNIVTKEDLQNLLNDVIANSSEKGFLETTHGSILVEYTRYYSQSIGITLRGEYDDRNQLTLDFYYPVCNSMKVSTHEDITIERHIREESYAGICDDMRIGVSMIFFLQNGLEYMKENCENNLSQYHTSVNFSALSLQGKIMLPIKKNAKQKELIEKTNNARSNLIVRARQGDEEAIENLTLDDIDTYTSISRKILKEDVFSLVDTYFMPYGAECDLYSILGEIVDVSLETNALTKEEIYILSLECNGIPIELCINEKDLMGEPMVGRRFKGTVWLQGKINFSN